MLYNNGIIISKIVRIKGDEVACRISSLYLLE